MLFGLLHMKISVPGQIENDSHLIYYIIFLLIRIWHYQITIQFSIHVCGYFKQRKTLNQTHGYLPIVGEKVNGLFKDRDEISRRQQRMLYWGYFYSVVVLSDLMLSNHRFFKVIWSGGRFIAWICRYQLGYICGCMVHVMKHTVSNKLITIINGSCQK